MSIARTNSGQALGAPPVLMVEATMPPARKCDAFVGIPSKEPFDTALIAQNNFSLFNWIVEELVVYSNELFSGYRFVIDQAL